jgi:hypothetical protein
MAEQKSLFGFNDMRPKAKVPISKERILEVQRLLEKKDGVGAAAILRDVRYKLEAYERRISNKPENTSKPSNVRK